MRGVAEYSDPTEMYNDYMKELTEAGTKALNEAFRATWTEYLVTLDKKVKNIFNDVVDDYYESYTPQHYERNESMYDILQTHIYNDEQMSISFDPERMTPFRSGYTGEDGLYDQAFRKGWHGGAGSGKGHPSTGTPYWRTPYPFYNRWGRPAEVAKTPPIDDIKRRIADYEKDTMQADINEIWEKNVGSIRFE